MSGQLEALTWTPADAGAVVVPDTRRHRCSACGGIRNVPGQAYCRSCHATRMRQQRARDKARIQGRIHALQRQILMASLADGLWHTHQQLEAALAGGQAEDGARLADLPARLVELERAGHRFETHRFADGALQYRLRFPLAGDGPDGPNIGGAA